MHMPPLSLLLLLLLLPQWSQVRAASLPTEIVWMKNKVYNLAEQLVRKISTNISIPETRSKSSPSGDHYVCSVVQYLNISSGLISDNFSHALEIKREMASLSNFVDQTKQCHCSSRPMKEVPKELQKRQPRIRQSHTVTLTTFHLIKEYLKKLQMNLNQLDKCI